jgi:CRP-like cAMP-binding protein
LVVLDDWFVFKKGDEGNEMFFIRNGKADIVTEEGNILLSVTSGSFFGEIALFEGNFVIVPLSSTHNKTVRERLV